MLLSLEDVSKMFSIYVGSAVRPIVEAGQDAVLLNNSRPEGFTRFKQTPEGPELVTMVDLLTEERIIHRYRKIFPRVRFIAEENSPSVRRWLISRKKMKSIPQGHIGILDPCDGTVRLRENQLTWCSAFAQMVRGKIIGGVTYAPAYGYGRMFIAEITGGESRFAIFDRTAADEFKMLENPCGKDCGSKNLRVRIGYRMDSNPLFQALLAEVWKIPHVRIVRAEGCAWSLAELCLGEESDVCIHGPVNIYDLASSKIIFETSGGHFLPIRLHDDGSVTKLTSDLDLLAFQGKTVSFIAARSAELAHHFQSLYIKMWAASHTAKAIRLRSVGH